ncbi:MAG: DUF134 domain-containing protein [Candidatus Omnitrophica bacterium]|nr:DUF134 domain-containing protein [Candidatus Omnitrophota bacterium]MDD4013975.1 DUF134 domain-containing protein [Candidatus Omnitrophota bacterium]
MRPKKTRSVKCLPGERCFRPRCKPLNQVESTYVSIDEFEAIRLADLEGLSHAEASRKMKISRPTFTRILESAHKKVADGLVNIKAIRIEGGCCTIAGRERGK